MAASNPESNRIAAVGATPLFAGLAPAEARQLAATMSESSAAAGEVVFREGEPGNRFYIVVDGCVDIVKALGTEDERLLSFRGPGEFFGEMSLLDPEGLRTASIRARSTTHMLSIGREDFDSLLRSQPALAYEIVRVLTLQLRDANNTTITDLRHKNEELSQAYAELKAAHEQIIAKEKLEQELRTAAWIQQSILPARPPILKGYDLAARMMPARTVGGDLYDFIPLSKSRVGIAIGDVSDKGVPAAIFMALTSSILRAEATRSASPKRVLERVNRLLLGMNEAGMFVTLLYGVLDAAGGTFSYARAGHELPLLLDHGGIPRFAPLGSSTPLALFDPPMLDEQVMLLREGSRMILYTDGVTDVMNAHGEQYGLERLRATAGEVSGAETSHAICDGLWERLVRFQGDAEQADDVALLIVSATNSLGWSHAAHAVY